MTQDDLQNAFKIRISRRTTTTGVTTCYSMAQDIIDNTRRAFSVDPTSATGYSALGVPKDATSRRPATPGVHRALSGRLRRAEADRPQRTDVRAVRHPRRRRSSDLPGRLTVEFSFEMMNLFDNINFNPAFNPGARHDDLPGDERIPRHRRRRERPRRPARAGGLARQLVGAGRRWPTADLKVGATSQL